MLGNLGWVPTKSGIPSRPHGCFTTKSWSYPASWDDAIVVDRLTISRFPLFYIYCGVSMKHIFLFFIVPR